MKKWLVTLTWGLEVEADTREQAIAEVQERASEDMSAYDCDVIAIEAHEEEQGN